MHIKKEFAKLIKDEAKLKTKEELEKEFIKKLVREFIKWHKNEQISLIKAVELEIEKIQVELCKKFANTPLNERKSGWDWILKYRDDIKQKLLLELKEIKK